MELTARFQSDTTDPTSAITFSLHCVELSVDSQRLHFASPLTDGELAELRWYLEAYPKWPTGPDYERAHKLEAEMEGLGRKLWASLFDTGDAIRIAQQFLSAADEPKILTIDAVEPDVLRLPWEMLADEDGHLFNASPPVVVRRRMQRVKQAKAVPFSLPLRVLMVISRPVGVGFLDPRSSAVALLDALAPLGDQAEVEFLRPPTAAALTERLTDPDRPPVHVVHFDGHGVYDPAIGLGYLLFEDGEQQRDAVNANRLGTLLNQANIPLMVLDACQTGDAGDLSAFTGVAARLIRSGVGSVLAMNYSVLVETTRRLTGAFYAELTRGRTIGQALDRARLDLLADTGRHRIYRPASDSEETIQLSDWFLPALYQQQADPAPFATAPLTSAVAPTFPADPVPRLPARGGFPPDPRHGFHGRARELLALERAFARRRIVVLHGFGGQGKTALSTQAGVWLTRTGLFRQALFLSVEQGGGLELALAEFGHGLLGQDFNIHDGEPVAAIAEALARTPTLLVLDNFESILPGGDVALPPTDLTALLDAAAAWASQGESRLLITTRDTSFGHDAYAPGRGCVHIPLAGLAGEEALELAGQILEDRSIPRPGRASLQELLSALGGHPLSLQLVLPHLADPAIRGDVAALIAEFEALLPGFVEGQAAERNTSLKVSLDFSLRRLGAETRALLPSLGVFQGGAMEFMISGAAGQSVLPEMDEALWRAVRAELSQTSLLTAEDIPGVNHPFIKFHPTLAPYLAAQLEPEQRAALDERFRQAYHQLAGFLYHNDNQNPIQSRAMAVRELPNLRRALHLHRAAGDLDAAVELADRIAKFLGNFGRWRERDVMMAQVAEGMTRRQDDRMTGGAGEGLTKAEFTLASRQGETLLGQGRAAEAEAIFRALLARMEGGMAYGGTEAGYHRAITLARLGRSLADQGQAGAAEGVYRQALDALAGLEQTDSVRRQTGAAHTDLADVLAAQGRYAEARTEYEKALRMIQDIGDDRSVAAVQGQLGALALREGDRDEARRRYRQALESFRGLGEERSEAIIWHQLGMVAQEDRAWDEAEGYYRESLAIKERIGDKALAATTCNQLATVAQLAGRPAQAERWFRRTLEYAELLPDRGARVYNNLANLLLTAYESADGPRPDLVAAEGYALKAVAILEQLDLSAEPWKIYNILAQIAEAKGDEAGARVWRRKEQETFAAFPGSWARLQGQFGPIVQAVVAAVAGEPGVKEAVEKLFPQLEQANWQIVDAIQRIWAGERDVWALTEGIDRDEALIVRKILAALDGETDVSGPGASAAAAASSQPPQGEGISLQEVLALVLAGCRGDLQQGQRAYDLTGQVLQNPQQPPEVRALGVALQRLLIGMRDRDEILKGLSGSESELAREAVDSLLAQLG